MIRVGSEPFLECSSKGEKRLSSLYAKIRRRNNRTIEELYQRMKMIPDGSGNLQHNLSFREAKGKVPANLDQCRSFFSLLWDEYMDENPDLIELCKQYNGFSDIFGQPGSCCQAVEIHRIVSQYR
jgi:hypothetical protein